MRLFSSKVLFALLIVFTLINTACAKSDCVFDNDYFNESRYQKNSNIVEYVWSEDQKTAKGITKRGYLFSVKHWSCNHFGTHAVMLVGPYISNNLDAMNDQLLALANIALDAKEVDMIKKRLSSDPIKLTSSSDKVYIQDSGYSEFYLMYTVVNESLVLEIKFYKD